MASQDTAITDGWRVGRSYTRARRYPWMIYKIHNWPIPRPFGPLTPTQLGVLCGTILLLWKTGGTWMRFGRLNLLLLIGLPPLLTWLVRHAKLEGRSPMETIAGVVTVLTDPPGGWIAGGRARQARPVWITGRVLVAPPPSRRPVPAEQVVPAPAAAAPPVPVRPAAVGRRSALQLLLDEGTAEPALAGGR